MLLGGILTADRAGAGRTSTESSWGNGEKNKVGESHQSQNLAETISHPHAASFVASAGTVRDSFVASVTIFISCQS